MGSSTFTASPRHATSSNPTSSSPTSSDPPEQPAAGGMGQANQEHADEDGHLGQGGHAEVGAADHGGPRKQVDRVDGKDHIKKRVEEVAHIGMRPTLANGVHAALIRGE